MTYRLQGIYTAIADPYRRDIMDMLYEAPLSAGDIAKKFDISRPAVSRHLRVLGKCGLVVVEKRGRERLFRLNPEPLGEVFTWLERFERFWDESLFRLKTLVEAEAVKTADQTAAGELNKDTET